MITDKQEPFLVTMLLGDEWIETTAPSASHILEMLQEATAWGGGSVHPRSTQFPRIHLSLHSPHGFVLQSWEKQTSWSDFLASSAQLGSPTVEIEHDGQGLELWPEGLFLSSDLVLHALEWFLDHRVQCPDLNWFRIDEFPRTVVREGGS